MDKKDIEKVLEKRNKRIPLTKEEKLLLDSYYLFLASLPKEEPDENIMTKNLNSIQNQLNKNLFQKRIWSKWLYAAASLLLISSFTYYFIIKRNSLEKLKQVDQFSLIGPGGKKALLEFSNGQRMYLDSSQSLSNLSNVSNNNELMTLTIPAGGEFETILPDGTTVHLNSSSSIKFPSRFIGSERTVELIGEAYFEVKRNVKKPFKVKTELNTIQVLGTGFNVSAYPGDPKGTKTTLVHGKVSVNAKKHPPIILHPGEQSFNDASGIIVQKVNVDREVGWTKGKFIFDQENILSVTGQLERWYDIKFIIGDNKLKNKTISGTISRNVTFENIVEMLSFFDINCTIKGRTVYLNNKLN